MITAENGAHIADKEKAEHVYRNGCDLRNEDHKECPLYELCHYHEGAFLPEEAALIFLGGLGKL